MQMYTREAQKYVEETMKEAREHCSKREAKQHDNKLLELLKASRTLVLFNTGTRRHKSKKDYNRRWKDVDKS